MINSIMAIAGNYGAISLFVCLILCSFGLPLAKSLVIVVGGILAGAGSNHPVLLFLGCSLGLHGGDFALFLIGRHFGDAVFDFKWIRAIAPVHQVDRARHFIARYGAASILMARITPFIRSLCYISLGSLKMQPLRFFVINYAVAAVYTAVFFLIGFLIGNNPDKLQQLVRSGNTLFVLAALTVVTGIFLFKKNFSLMARPSEASVDADDISPK